MACTYSVRIWAIVCPACEIVAGTLTTHTGKLPACHLMCVCGGEFTLRAPEEPRDAVQLSVIAGAKPKFARVVDGAPPRD